MAETKRVIIDVKDNLADVTGRLIKLRKQQADLNKQIKNTNTDTAEGAKQYNELTTQLVQVQRNIKGATKEQKLLNKELDEVEAADGSYDELVAQTNRLRQALKALPNAFDPANKEAEELRREIKSNNDQLKAFDKTIGDNQRSVGDYELALGGLNSTFPALGSRAQSAGTAFKAFNNILKSNPILLVAGLLAGLVASFAKTREGSELLNSVMTGLNTAFQAFTDVLAPIGKALIKTIIAPFKSAFFVIKSVGDLVSGDFTQASENFNKAIAVQGEVVGQWADSIQEVGDNIQHIQDEGGLTGIAKRAAEISIAFERLDDLSRSVTTRLQSQNQELKNLRLEAANRALSEEERLRLVERIQKQEEAIKQTFDEQIDIARRRLELTKENNALADSSKEDLEAQANLERELNNLINERTRREIEANNVIADQRLKAEAQRKASLKQELEDRRKFEEQVLQLEREFDEIRRKDQEEAKSKRQAEQDAEILRNVEILNNQEQQRKQAAKNEEQREQLLAKTKVSLQNEVFGVVKNLTGKNAKLQKAVAIAEATRNVAQGVTKALATLPPPASFVAAAGVGIKGAVEIGKIAATPVPKAEKGGKFAKLKGPSHAQGGIDLFTRDGKHVINAEGDEEVIVMTKGASAIDALARENVAHGGINFGSKPVVAEKGARLNLSGATSNIDSQNQLISAIRNAPNPIVTVQDINLGQQNVQVVDQGASL